MYCSCELCGWNNPHRLCPIFPLKRIAEKGERVQGMEERREAAYLALATRRLVRL
jgi:hypothetical protein